MTSEAGGQVKVLWSSLFRVKVSRVKENNITSDDLLLLFRNESKT